jgi:FixJ family two-component response regulator
MTSDDSPIVFIVDDDTRMRAALQSGAVVFLTKPFQDQDLRDAIQQTLKRDRRGTPKSGKSSRFPT